MHRILSWGQLYATALTIEIPIFSRLCKIFSKINPSVILFEKNLPVNFHPDPIKKCLPSACLFSQRVDIMHFFYIFPAVCDCNHRHAFRLAATAFTEARFHSHSCDCNQRHAFLPASAAAITTSFRHLRRRMRNRRQDRRF